MRTLLPRALLLLLPLVGLVIGCTGGHDGRFLVVVSSDIPSPDQLARVRVEVGEDAHEFVLGEGTRLPFSFAVDARPGRPDEDPVTIVVSGLDATGAVLMSFPVTTRFRPNRTLVLPVTLLRRCTALALCGEQLRCGASEACTPDGCVAADVRNEDLREISTPGDEVVASLTPEALCVEFADLRCAALGRRPGEPTHAVLGGGRGRVSHQLPADLQRPTRRLRWCSSIGRARRGRSPRTAVQPLLRAVGGLPRAGHPVGARRHRRARRRVWVRRRWRVLLVSRRRVCARGSGSRVRRPSVSGSAVLRRAGHRRARGARGQRLQRRALLRPAPRRSALRACASRWRRVPPQRAVRFEALCSVPRDVLRWNRLRAEHGLPEPRLRHDAQHLSRRNELRRRRLPLARLRP